MSWLTADLKQTQKQPDRTWDVVMWIEGISADLAILSAFNLSSMRDLNIDYYTNGEPYHIITSAAADFGQLVVAYNGTVSTFTPDGFVF